MQVLNQEAVDLVAALRSRDVSCEDVMRATLERITEVNGSINALISLNDSEHLLEQARAADVAGPKGALFGLPFAVKELESVAGMAHSEGSPIFKDRISPKDSPMVHHLREAGAIFIGKTNVPEFGLGSHSYNPVYGVTRNPYDTNVTAGGSSGGAAAALATRMVALADGSDMMGSLRNPAAFCNVYGFRPSWGVIPRGPDGETFLQQLSTNGPMARSPRDLALLMDVIAQPDPQVPHNAPPQNWTLQAPERLEGIRIGWLADWGGAYPMEAGVLSQCEAGLSAFADLGAEVTPVMPPFSAEELWHSWAVLRHWAVANELGQYFKNPETCDLLKPAAIWEVEAGLSLDGEAIAKAGAIRSKWFATLASLFETYDFLVLPSAQVWPFPVDWDWPKEVAGHSMDTYHRWMEVVVPVSLAGVPCISVPCGFGAAGLPMGMQVFARKGGDLALLNAAQTYHAATHWPDIPPQHIQHG
ncbi:amidase [Shimia thalassica]|uniref:amidase n=1 Tax=Shimia thalassica TaxID=1715693 RepID=UPI0026E32F23|nr:amidase [Shimia thalassica]MDO6479855.1 amidase [Shimia thalassica]